MMPCNDRSFNQLFYLHCISLYLPEFQVLVVVLQDIDCKPYSVLSVLSLSPSHCDSHDFKSIAMKSCCCLAVVLLTFLLSSESFKRGVQEPFNSETLITTFDSKARSLEYLFLGFLCIHKTCSSKHEKNTFRFQLIISIYKNLHYPCFHSVNQKREENFCPWIPVPRQG